MFFFWKLQDFYVSVFIIAGGLCACVWCRPTCVCVVRRGVHVRVCMVLFYVRVCGVPWCTCTCMCTCVWYAVYVYVCVVCRSIRVRACVWCRGVYVRVWCKDVSDVIWGIEQLHDYKSVLSYLLADRADKFK